MSCFSFGTLFLLSLTWTQFGPALAVSPALILTPYIFQNQTQEARNASRVDPSLFLNVTSHSGFLTLDDKYNSSTFFWYFPVAKKPVNETPWIIWLQGGPGASSLDGLFLEMGPFQYDGQLKKREWSWCEEYSMVFLDNPVGAGYSFTDSKEGFVRDMATYAEHLHIALQQLLTLFPDLQTAPLYVAGESYAGRYVPAFATKILESRDMIGNLPVNLQGLIMGNPVLNRESLANFTALFYNWGLVDAQGALSAKPLQDQYFKAIADHDDQTAVVVYDKLLTKLQDMTSQQQLYNLLEDGYDMHGFEKFLAKEEIKQALHVGNIPFTFSNGTVHAHLVKDFLSEVDSKVEALLEHYRVLIYCGQLDLTAPCVPSAEARRHWRWSHRDAFMAAPRQPFWFDESVAGYVKSGGGLTEALIRGAGHLVPMDKPAQVHQLVSRFIQGLDMPVPPNYVADKPPNYNFNTSDTKIYVTPKSPEKEPNAKGRNSHEGSVPNDNASLSQGLVASIAINVILVVVVLSGAFYCIRRRRRNVFYSSIDNISDEIFLS